MAGNGGVVTSGPVVTRGLQWEGVFLTPLEERDLDLIYSWQNSPNLRDLTMGFRFPIQKDAVRDWLKDIKEQNARTRVVFAIRVRDVLVGTVSLHSIEQFQRKALFGICIGDGSERSKGIGYISTCLILDYAFNGLDFRKISLEVVATNSSAIALYDRIGFVKEGTRRKEYFVDGKCIDTHVYGMLREEFGEVIPKAANRLVHAF
jgi:RimJ/RimL family protein N-acetyltransferase